MKISSSFTLSLFALVLLGAGCADQKTLSSISLAGRSGNCDHPYYPLRAGTKVEYASRVASVLRSKFSWEVADVTSDHARLVYHFGPTLSMDSDVSCSDDGLRVASYLNMASGMSKMQIKTKTLSSSGQFLPRDLHVGSSWTNTYEVESENNFPGADRLGMAKSHMTMTTMNTAIGEETVTVPAGTFTALKVKSVNKTSTQLSPKMPASDTELTSYVYYVRGKGMVKTETTDAAGMTFGFEATSIVTP